MLPQAVKYESLLVDDEGGAAPLQVAFSLLCSVTVWGREAIPFGVGEILDVGVISVVLTAL